LKISDKNIVANGDLLKRHIINITKGKIGQNLEQEKKFIDICEERLKRIDLIVASHVKNEQFKTV
jgi:hypothetical protein